MSIEAGVVLDLNGEALHWHLPPGRHGGALPDSPDLWKVLWENRERISGFAHSHPGSGLPGPSHTDVTTFAAVEQGLGKRLAWFITSSDSWVLLRWRGPGRFDYKPDPIVFSCPEQPMMTGDPPWIAKLRDLSNYDVKPVEWTDKQIEKINDRAEAVLAPMREEMKAVKKDGQT